ncbi:hypothetical protein BDL97_05G048000 [Sphagnum fallax]|nr:hypothetical protein BDL97_05G048000 [Sphagnum fallax]
MENQKRSFCCVNTQKGLEIAAAWLGPRELASLALTCRAMTKCVAELTERRVADVAQGLERWSVPVCNQFDSCRYPWFVYTPFCLLSTSRSSSSSFHSWGNESSSSSSSSKESLFSDARKTCLKELGILPSTGILGAVGCRCAGDCALLAHGTITELPLPSEGVEDESCCEEVCVVRDDSNSSCENNGRRRRRRGGGQSLGECFCGKTSDGYCAYDAATSKLCLLMTRVTTTSDECRKTNLLDKINNNRVDNNVSCDGMSSSLDLNGEEEEEEGKEQQLLLEEEERPLLVMECGGACSCSSNMCGFRVTQQGLAVGVAVVRKQNTGWGLHATQLISKGSFVCEYAGELLTTREAQQRQKVYDIVEEAGNELKLLHKKKRRRRCGSALLVLREFLPSKQACVRLNIDATREEQ